MLGWLDRSVEDTRPWGGPKYAPLPVGVADDDEEEEEGDEGTGAELFGKGLSDGPPSGGGGGGWGRVFF